MTARSSAFLVATAALWPATALAHPGHGTTAPHSWAHHLTEPTHVISLAALGVIAAAIGLAGRWSRARRRRRVTPKPG